MYASAMKFCGAMELCGIGWPRGEPMDSVWPEVEAQVKAQKAGLIVSICREAKPEEADLMKSKGFVAVYKFTNPRTGNVGVLWIKDCTGEGSVMTRLPERIDVVASDAPPRARPPARTTVRDMTVTEAIDALAAPSVWLDAPQVMAYTGYVAGTSSPHADDAPF